MITHLARAIVINTSMYNVYDDDISLLLGYWATNYDDSDDDFDTSTHLARAGGGWTEVETTCKKRKVRRYKREKI